MAGLNDSDRAPGSRDSRSRGQMMLVGAITIGLLLLGLGAVLNSATIAEQRATADVTQPSASSALQYRHAVERGVEGVVFWVNHPDAPDRKAVEQLGPGLPTDLEDTTESELSATLEDETNAWSNLSGKLAAMETGSTSVRLTSVNSGSRIAQYENRNFTNQNNSANWTLVDGAGGLRRSRLNVSTETVEDEFEIVVSDGSDSWTFEFRESGSGIEVVVDSPTASDSCTADSEWVLIDLMAGTVNGTSCPALDGFATFAASADTVKFRNGSEISGRYELLVNEDASAVTDGQKYEGEGGPEVEPAVYGATVELTYRTESLTYVTSVEIVPGETDA